MIHPLPEGQSVPEGRASTIKWPDRSPRTLAEVWKLSAEEVEAEHKSQEGVYGAD